MTIERLPSVLVSFAYRRDWSSVAGNSVAAIAREVVLDSGAFTAAKQGKAVDLVEFAEWAKEMRRDPLVTEVFTLDIIGGSWRESLANTERLHKLGVPAMPVYHVGEPTDVLKALARDYPKVALGGAVGYAKKMEWAALCFRAVWPAKLHGLGFGPQVLAKLPFHTIDHSWSVAPYRFLQYAAYDGLSIPLPKGAHVHGHSVSVEIEHQLKEEATARSFWHGRLPADWGDAPSIRLASTGSAAFSSLARYATEHPA